MVVSAPNTARVLLQSLSKTARTSPFICAQCRSQGFSAWSKAPAPKRLRLPSSSIGTFGTRQWSNSGFRLAEKPFDDNPKSSQKNLGIEGNPRDKVFEMPAPPSLEPEQKHDEIPIPPQEPPLPPPQDAACSDPLSRPLHDPESPLQLPASSATTDVLPSERARERLEFSERLHVFMDGFLAKAAVASKRVNNYTGTDYSGIEQLRREIIEQEQLVRTSHAAVETAKEAYASSYIDQAASQKEVVGLLERKHSWTAGDLERYMSLIRSEHLNEQAVQAAKDELASAERTLEEARSLLEKKERKQYHEEQVWSDTIRRNSTWVTFGLMGLNIFLLLANLVIIEPWRRRRLVKEVRSALEEKTVSTTPVDSAIAATPAAAEGSPAVEGAVEAVAEKIETVVDEVVDSAGAALEVVESEIAETVPESLQEMDNGKVVEETVLATGEVLPEEAIEVAPSVAPEGAEEPLKDRGKRYAEDIWAQLKHTWSQVQIFTKDLFSERQVTLKQVDVTTIALEGAAAGVAVVSFLFVLLRSWS